MYLVNIENNLINSQGALFHAIELCYKYKKH